jgi:hypothetical protein
MAISLSKLLQGQVVFIINRFLRLIYSVLVAAFFYSDELFLSFFVLEGALPIITLLFAYVYNRTNIYVSTICLLSLIPVGYAFSFVIITLIFVGEIISSFYAFNFERRVNQKYELAFNCVSLIGLLFTFELSFKYLLYFLLFATYGRLILYIYNSKCELPKVPSYFFSSLFRQLTSLNLRYFLAIFSVGPLFFIAFRILNQMILFVWSYLKSKTAFEWSKYFKLSPPISIIVSSFIVFNVGLLAQVFGFILFDSSIFFGVYLILVLVYLSYELNKATEVNENV